MSGPLLYDRVRESTTTTGTGTVTLAGAVTGYQSFSVVGNGNTCPYCIAGGSQWEVGVGTYTSSGTTLARTNVLASSTGSLISFSAGTKDVFLSSPAITLGAQGVNPGGRLTLTTALPVTFADTTSTTIYYTPYLHDKIPLWDGSQWLTITFSEVNVSAANSFPSPPYDVFGFLSSGALAIEKLVWTSANLRATDISLQDGRYCKVGDKTRLYLGSFYPASSTTVTDSFAVRGMFNNYNRTIRPLFTCPGYNDNNSPTTYNESGASLAAVNGGTGATLVFLIGLATLPANYFAAFTGAGSATGSGRFGVGENSASSIASICMCTASTVNFNVSLARVWIPTTVGFNSLTMLGMADSGATVALNADRGRTGAAHDPYGTYLSGSIMG